MKCPRCMQEIKSFNSNAHHYVCSNESCIDENGDRTQFKLVEDTTVKFPFNQIFVNRGRHEFYRKPYLKIKTLKSNI